MIMFGGYLSIDNLANSWDIVGLSNIVSHDRLDIFSLF